MLRKLRPRSVYDVFALLALVIAVGGTSAYAANTVFSADIVDGEVKAADIGNGEVGSADVKDNSLNTFDVHSFIGEDVIDGTLTGDDVKNEFLTGLDINNGSLNDEDVGQATFVDFLATVGPVAAQGCAYLPITGINATADHLLLTPSSVDAAGGLIYNVQYRQGQESAFLQACNNNDVVIDDGTTHFNLLVFDAQ